MDDDLTPEQRFAAEDAETLVPRALLLGKTPDEIVEDLIKLDYALPAARALVERIQREMREFNESPESRRRLIDAAHRQFLGGLIGAVIASGLTTALLGLMATSGGLGCFLVLASLFLMGGGFTMAGRGWARWRLYRGWERQIAEREKRRTQT